MVAKAFMSSLCMNQLNFIHQRFVSPLFIQTPNILKGLIRRILLLGLLQDAILL